MSLAVIIGLVTIGGVESKVIVAVVLIARPAPSVTMRVSGIDVVLPPLERYKILMGMLVPCEMEAWRLSSVRILGAEMMRAEPACSRALKRTLRLKAPPSEPMDRPIPPPEPVPTGAGRLTGAFDIDW